MIELVMSDLGSALILLLGLVTAWSLFQSLAGG